MKNIFALTFSLLLTLTAFSQYPTFKIDYKFVVDSTLFQMDENEMDEKQKILMTTASLLLAFEDGDKPVAQVWVNKDFVRAKTNFYGDDYEINQKGNNQSIFIYPESQQYYINNAPQDKLLNLGDSIKLASELPISFVEDQEKTIAGYRCKLAIITAATDEENEGLINVWYTDALPATYWGEYAYLKNIPGAALEISTSGIGIQASKVQSEGDPTIFKVPENYIQIDTPISSNGFFFGDDDNSMMESEKLNEFYLSDSLSAFLDEEQGLYGVKTIDGEVIIAPRFQDIHPYDNGLAVVSNQQYKYGAIDLQGQIVVPILYDDIRYNSIDNTFVFSKNGKYGIMTGDSQILIPNEYDYITFLNNDRAVVGKKNIYGIIDGENKVVVPLIYNNIIEIVGEYFIDFTNENECILYSFKGEKKATYTYISNANAENIFLVMEDQKYGYINADGKVIIPIIYEYASSFADGRATVVREGEEMPITINTRGEIVPE